MFTSAGTSHGTCHSQQALRNEEGVRDIINSVNVHIIYIYKKKTYRSVYYMLA